MKQVSPKKDMAKSPLRQPGAIEQAASAVRNLAADWNEAEMEEEQEAEENHSHQDQKEGEELDEFDPEVEDQKKAEL